MALFEEVLKKKAKENSVGYKLVQDIIKLQQSDEGEDTIIRSNRLKKLEKLVRESKK